MSTTPASATRSGFLFGVGAYLLWGAMPVYFLAMAPAGAFEIVGWRILFSLAFCVLLLTVVRSWGAFVRIVRTPRTFLLIGLAAVLIYVNWQTYVLATTTGRVVESALGYFINPVVTVLLGVLVLRERLRPWQWVAVGISTIAIVVLTVEAGQLPWVSLVIAGSWAFYGLVKKRTGVTVDAITGLTLESAWLVPLAVVQLLVVGATAGLAFGDAGAFPTVMLLSTGIGTAVPLLLFAAAARRLPLSVVGFLQYLAPILQFLTGVLLLDEPMPVARLIGFAFVWLALVVLVVEGVVAVGRGRRDRRRADARTGAVQAAGPA